MYDILAESSLRGFVGGRGDYFRPGGRDGSIFCGAQGGDIITRIGEIDLDDSHPYINALFQYEPYETITLQVYRGKQIIEVQVTLAELAIQ